eukprot:scaffold12935_cov85-Phaeocystis_antarctica.AAC.3
MKTAAMLCSAVRHATRSCPHAMLSCPRSRRVVPRTVLGLSTRGGGRRPSLSARSCHERD